MDPQDPFAIPDPFSAHPVDDMDDPQFMQFLEGLAADEMPFAPSVPIPLEHTSTPQTTETPPVSQSLASHPIQSVEVPTFTAAAVPSSTMPTKTGRQRVTAEERLEKLRAKNRRGQAKYREKCKKEIQELEQKLAAVRSSLGQSSERYRSLRHHRHSLLYRIKSATTPATDSCQTHGGPLCPVSGATQNLDAAAQHPIPVLPAPHCPSTQATDLPPVSSDREVVPTRAGRRGLFNEYEEVPRPISSFLHHAPISFSYIAPYMAKMTPGKPVDPNLMSAAVTEYQHAVCMSVSRPLSEICWFSQLPFEIQPGLSVSHSAGAFSPECCLSLSLCFAAITTEAFCLSLEHEQLETATNPCYVPPEHPGLDSVTVVRAAVDGSFKVGDDTLLPPTRPEEKLLETFNIRVGVNDVYPMGEAVRVVLQPMLARYRRSLPQERWRKVLLLSMRVLQSSVNAMRAKPAAPEDCSSEVSHQDVPAADEGTPESDDADRWALSGVGVTTGAKERVRTGGFTINPTEIGLHAEEMEGQEGMLSTNGGGKREMSWAQLDEAMMVMMQYMLCVFYEALVDRAPPQDGPQHATLEQVERRIFDLMATPGLSCRLMFQYAPVTARRMCMGQCGKAADDLIQMERLQMKTFSYLQLTADQKASFAAKWKSWFRRRLSLDRQLIAALTHLERVMPTDDVIPADLVQIINVAAGEAEEGGAGAGAAGVAAGLLEGPGAMDEGKAGAIEMADAMLSKADAQRRGFLATTAQLPANAPVLPAAPPVATQSQSQGSEGTPTGGVEHVSLYATSDVASSEMDAVLPPYVRDIPPVVVDPRMPKPQAGSVDGSVGSGWGGASTIRGAAVNMLPTAAVPISMDDGGPNSHMHMHAERGKVVSTGGHPGGPAVTVHSGSQGVARGVASRASGNVSTGTCVSGAMHEAGTRKPRWVAVAMADEVPEENVPQLLGCSGMATRAVEDAMEAVLDVHKCDSAMYHEYVSMTSLPSWILTEVQHGRMMSAHLELGVSMVDMLRLFQAAAHEQRWEALVSPLRTS